MRFLRRMAVLVRDHLCIAGYVFFINYAALPIFIWATLLSRKFSHLLPLAFVAGFLPIIICLLLRAVQAVRGAPEPVSQGKLNGYVLTETDLFFSLGRVLPLLRIPLKKANSIDVWRSLGKYAYGSDDNWFYCFFIGLWFWPLPIGIAMKNKFKIQALRFEYSISMASGWVIVIACSREFAMKINQAIRKNKMSGGDHETEKPRDTHNPSTTHA